MLIIDKKYYKREIWYGLLVKYNIFKFHNLITSNFLLIRKIQLFNYCYKKEMYQSVLILLLEIILFIFVNICKYSHTKQQ